MNRRSGDACQIKGHALYYWRSMREESLPNGQNDCSVSIYAVDDESIIGQMIEAVLSSEGYTLKVFDDPCSLLEAFKQADPKPKIILTDYFMGKMNGLELLTRCK